MCGDAPAWHLNSQSYAFHVHGTFEFAMTDEDTRRRHAVASKELCEHHDWMVRMGSLNAEAHRSFHLASEDFDRVFGPFATAAALQKCLKFSTQRGWLHQWFGAR